MVFPPFHIMRKCSAPLVPRALRWHSVDRTCMHALGGITHACMPSVDHTCMHALGGSYMHACPRWITHACMPSVDHTCMHALGGSHMHACPRTVHERSEQQAHDVLWRHHQANQRIRFFQVVRCVVTVFFFCCTNPHPSRALHGGRIVMTVSAQWVAAGMSSVMHLFA
jgi:hypothetical protein